MKKIRYMIHSPKNVDSFIFSFSVLIAFFFKIAFMFCFIALSGTSKCSAGQSGGSEWEPYLVPNLSRRVFSNSPWSLMLAVCVWVCVCVCVCMRAHRRLVILFMVLLCWKHFSDEGRGPGVGNTWGSSTPRNDLLLARKLKWSCL